jgi:hypothetical protein
VVRRLVVVVVWRQLVVSRIFGNPIPGYQEPRHPTTRTATTLLVATLESSPRGFTPLLLA